MIRKEIRVLILTRIERYLNLTRTSASSFGRAASSDPSLVFDLRRGRRLGPAVQRRIEAYLTAQEAMLRGARCRAR